MSYRLGGELPIPEVSAGTNLMISGPPMTGKYRLMLELLGSESDNVVVISTQHVATKIRDDFSTTNGFEGDADVGVIDCVSQLRGGEVGDTPETTFVATPKNLTRIGVAFTDFYSRWENQPTRVGFHSLSNLLMYSELRTVYKFLQVLTGQIHNAGWMSVVVYDPTMHDEQITHTLQDPFDGIVQTREEGGDRELRIRGFEDAPTDWIGF